MNALARISASPYARRLARERGVAIGGMAGSGPNGRIVAADVLAAVEVAPPPPAIADAPAPAVIAATAPVREIGAFAASIGLPALRALIEAAGVDTPLEAFFVKAAASSAEADAIAVAGADNRLVRIDGAARLAPSAIAEAVKTAGDGSAPLQLSVIRQGGIRPVAATLAEGCTLRLLVAIGEGPLAEALLVHDAAAVSEAAAAAMLAAFRDAIENPLRLLV